MSGINGVVHVTVYKNPRSYSAFPSLEVMPDGSLICVFREAVRRKRRTHIDPTSKAVLVRSSNGGLTWNPESRVVIYEEEECGIQDPSVRLLSDGSLIVNFFKWHVGVEEELPDGHASVRGLDGIHYAWMEGTYVTKSRDGGYTWDEPVKVSTPLGDFTATSEPVLELPNGELLIPVYGRLPTDAIERAMVLRSRDGGKTWGDPSTIAYDPFGLLGFYEPSLLYLPRSGKIVCMLRVHRRPREEYGYYLYQSESLDLGETWTIPKRTVIWGHPPNLILLRSGNLLCSYGYRRPPYGVRACISRDDGRTWNLKREFIIRSDGLDGDLGYPSSVQLNDGSIATAYYFRDPLDDVTFIGLSIYSEEVFGE